MSAQIQEVLPGMLVIDDLEEGKVYEPSPDLKTDGVEASLSFQNVKFSVSIPKSKTEAAKVLHVLKGVSGSIKPGSMTALMGASGAGKTSLLNCLACRPSGGTSSGQLLINGEPASRSKFRSMTSYVTQVSPFPPLLIRWPCPLTIAPVPRRTLCPTA